MWRTCKLNGAANETRHSKRLEESPISNGTSAARINAIKDEHGRDLEIVRVERVGDKLSHKARSLLLPQSFVYNLSCLPPPFYRLGVNRADIHERSRPRWREVHVARQSNRQQNERTNSRITHSRETFRTPSVSPRFVRGATATHSTFSQIRPVRKASHFPANRTISRARATNTRRDSSSRTDNAGRGTMLAVGAGRARPETAENRRHRARECITCDDRLTAARLTIDVPPMLSANSAGRRLTACL